MSTESVQKVIGRAATEAQFRALLFRDPALALAGYDLSEPEAASLRQLSPEAFDSVVRDLEQRVSRSEIVMSSAPPPSKGESVTNLSKSDSDF